MSQTAFLFPGQGAQQIGMGQQALAECEAARALFARAEPILGYDLAELCANGPEERINATNISQPALFVCSLAALELLRQNSPDVIDSAQMTAGLSLGEYTALVFADAMSFEDGLKVVRQRGESMQAAAEAVDSGMASILMLEVADVGRIVDAASSAGLVRIANYLCPKNYVISGERAALELAIEKAEAESARIVPLPVAGAFHTDLMAPAVEPLRDVLASVELRSPRIPVVSNVDAVPHDDPDEIRDLLVRQVVSPVRWEDSVRYLLEEGMTEFYEIGPGTVLKGLMKRIHRKTPVTNVTG